MARKKRVKRRTTRRVSRRATTSKSVNIKRKVAVVINNLLLFVALALVSFVLFRFLTNELLKNLFQVMAMVFGFISVGFLITFLILMIIKVVKKK